MEKIIDMAVLYRPSKFSFLDHFAIDCGTRSPFDDNEHINYIYNMRVFASVYKQKKYKCSVFLTEPVKMWSGTGVVSIIVKCGRDNREIID